MPKTRPIEERFDEKVARSDGCWLWTAARNRDGYGTFNLGLGRGTDVAHRIAWKLQGGDIPVGMEVCHRCDERACVRPDHLFLGTHGDNVRDCFAKGRARGHRYQGGSGHHASRLTPEQVAEIRTATGKQKDIGAMFGIGQQQVSRIKNGKRWRCDEIERVGKR